VDNETYERNDMATAEMTEVKLENVGPINGEFKIHLDGPGLYELRGSKGRGKTTALSALSLISGHKVALTVHDGELSGSVEGFGVVAPVGSRKKSRGECSVDTLDTEKFDLVDLIDPDGKTPETRDSVRIKALASLINLKLEPSDYYDLVGGQTEFEELGVAETDDPVLFASRVKAALDKAAKQKEDYSKTEVGHAKALEEQASGVDLNAESDPESLADAVDKASADLTALEQQAKAALEAIENTKRAKERLYIAQESYDGPPVTEAQAVRDAKQQELNEALELKQQLELQLQRAKESLAAKQGEYNETVAVLAAAEQHAADIQRWKDSIGDPVEPVPQEKIEAAKVAKQKARDSHEAGVRIRDAKKAAAQAQSHKAAAVDADAQASDLRGAASEVFGILTEKLRTSVIRIEQVAGSPRLVVDHPDRGKTLFDQVDGLSDGERVRASIDELLPLVKSPGLFAIPQRTYQDLPPTDREQLAAYANENGLYLFGAQVTDGDLSVVKL